MKPLTQIVFPLVVFVLLIGGITFVSQWVNTDTGSGDSGALTDKPPETKPEYQLAFSLSPEDDSKPEYEMGTPSHQDFWFENHNQEPGEIGLLGKSCTCQSVRILSLSPAETSKLHRSIVSIACGLISSGFDNPREVVALIAAAGFNESMVMLTDPNSKKWESMERDSERTVVVAAKGAGLVRMGWDGKKGGEQRFRATLYTQAQANPHTRGQMTLEVPCMVVQALRVQPSAVEIPEIGSDGQQSGSLDCWSSTRSGYQLTATIDDPNPCFSTQVRALTEDERTKLEGSLNKDGKSKTKVLYGHHVTINVKERATVQASPTEKATDQNTLRDGPSSAIRVTQEKHLDLGPFHHDITLVNDLGQEARCEITGLVHGDIRVGGADDRGRVSLGTFPTREGGRKIVLLEADRPNLNIDLEIESKSPYFLDVKLTSAEKAVDGTRRWNLDVSVPPNKLQGRFTRESGIVLKSKGSTERKVRIPVTGIGIIPLTNH